MCSLLCLPKKKKKTPLPMLCPSSKFQAIIDIRYLQRQKVHKPSLSLSTLNSSKVGAELLLAQDLAP